MNTILKIGSHYVSDFIKTDSDYNNKNKYSLDLQIENSTGAGILHYLSTKKCVHARQTVLKFERCDARKMTLVWRI